MRSFYVSLYLIALSFSLGSSPAQKAPLYLNDYDEKASIAPDIHTFNGFSYSIIRFPVALTQSDKTYLTQLDIHLLDYIPYHAYLISFPDKLNTEILAEKFPGSRFIPLSAIQRLSPSLANWLTDSENASSRDINIIPFPSTAITVENIRSSIGRYSDDFNIGQRGIIRTHASPDVLSLLLNLPWVYYIEGADPLPLPENGRSNLIARANTVKVFQRPDLQLNGRGVNIALGDDGSIGPHIDFTSRIDNSQSTYDLGTHADHVAGTLIGAGNLNPDRQGLAPAARLWTFGAWEAINQIQDLNQAFNITITSQSISNGCNAGYTSFTQYADRTVRESPELLHVFSAGNVGGTDCGYGLSGWGNITGGVKSGKNVLAVGNLTKEHQLAASSSRGPATDGRIKPDICALGSSVNSTQPDHTYATFSGTSMSCPAVSGAAALLTELYISIHDTLPQADLLRGILCNSAVDIGNPGPDFKTGYGRLHLGRAASLLREQSWRIDSLGANQERSYLVNIPEGISKLKLMLNWTDREGSLLSLKALVNDLDVKVISPDSSVLLPWVLDPGPTDLQLNSPAERNPDHLNNVEQVTVNHPDSGIHRIVVKGFDIPFGAQRYFLSWLLIPELIDLDYPQGGEGVPPNSELEIKWTTTMEDSIEIKYTVDGGNVWNTIAQNLAPETHSFTWQIPNQSHGNVKIAILQGTKSDTSSSFSIFPAVKNLTFSSSCPEYYQVSWSEIANVDHYTIFRLGENYMDSIGTSDTANFEAQWSGLSVNEWIAVAATPAGGISGPRSIAQLKDAGIWNCLEPNDAGLTGITGLPEGEIPHCVLPYHALVNVVIENKSPNKLENIPLMGTLNGIPLPNDTIRETIEGFGTLEYTPNYTFTLNDNDSMDFLFWTSYPDDHNQANDTISRKLIIHHSRTFNAPLQQDFENFSLCGNSNPCGDFTCDLIEGWTNVSQEEGLQNEWQVRYGSTPSPGTGPDKDQFPGTETGRYIYIEGSRCHKSSGQLLSPCIFISGMTSPYLEFWFHITGQHAGSLEMDIYFDGQWTKNIIPRIESDWGDKWWPASLDLSPYTGKRLVFRFRAQTGIGDFSDIALDNFSIREGFTMEHFTEASTPIFSLTPGGGNHNTFTLSNELDAYGLEILDMRGKKTLTFPSAKSGDEIDLSGLANGMYIVIMNHSTGMGIQKVILTQ